LLSIAFHPRFAQNHLVYADYTALDHSTHVVEYTVSGGVAVPSSARTLLVVPQPYPNHKGGQLQFDPRGRLYVGMGDGGSNAGSPLNDPDNRGQNPATRLGKLLRTDPVSGTGWQVIGSGLRNPWRFSFDRLTGSLWLGDVGAGTFEELDVRPAAKLDQAANYGWSRYEGPAFYNQKVKLRGKGALVAPILAYTHQSGGCSIVGGYVYRGAQVAQAQGRYFFGDYCTGSIWSFPAKLGLRSHTASIVRRNDGYVQDLVSFGEGADGTLYAVSIDGGVYVLGQ
jgi:glucose/arabinose dehydrogenase